MGHHILVPVDGSPGAEKAFEHALEALPEPTITLVHVLNPVEVWGYGDEDSFDLDGYQREEARRREAAEQMLAEYEDRATAGGIEVESIITTGRPAKRILAFAEERDVDHIVMGSRGRSGAGRVLFGSVAETVTRRATVPVTIVR